jgi:hypothetical protein
MGEHSRDRPAIAERTGHVLVRELVDEGPETFPRNAVLDHIGAI